MKKTLEKENWVCHTQNGIKGLKSTFKINVFLFKLQESVTNLYSKKISR